MSSSIPVVEPAISGSFLQDPLRIILEVLGRICLEIESLPAVRKASEGLPPKNRFRATVLLYRKAHGDFVITPIRMVYDQPAAASTIQIAPMEGLLKLVWRSAKEGNRTATAISLPKFDSQDSDLKDKYFKAWANWGVLRTTAEKFRRKGRFYAYIPLIKNRRAIGMLVLDANIPITSKRLFARMMEVVGRNIGCLEACFCEDIDIDLASKRKRMWWES